MSFSNKTRVLTGALLAAGALTAAHAHDYTYLEGGYVDVDRGYSDDSGARIAGSLSVTEGVAVIGEYSDTGDVSQLSAGALFHTPLNNVWDLVLGGTLEHVDTGADDDTGFGLRGGAHWRNMNGRLQLEPELRLVDVYEDTAFSARMGAQYEIAPRLDLAGALQGGDDDRLELGVRYRFGR